MHTGDHVLIGGAKGIPIGPARPIISYAPVTLPTPGRHLDIELRVTVPSQGDKLPIILLSHGQGRSNWLSSLEGYAPLYEFWAAHGFAVLQPTHLRSAFLGLQAPQGNEMFWKDGPEDMVHILDNLDQIEDSVPGLKRRLDRTRVAVVGHSAGAWTAMLLLGVSNTDPRDGSEYYKPEARIGAGVILAGKGKGGADLSDTGKTRLPYYEGDFSRMSTPSLIVCGDEDRSPWFTTRNADWHADSYVLAPAPKDLLVLRGGNHVLGGISGWDARETVDESVERVAVVQRMTWAYLWSQLYQDSKIWAAACSAFSQLEIGTVESKS